MGYMAHNAIIVTSWNHEGIEQAAKKATELGLLVTPVSAEGVNGYKSFMVCPDGSKEGWAPSNEGDIKRSEFRDYLNSVTYEDGSSSMEWVEIRYGSDDDAASIVDSAFSATGATP